MTSTTKELSVAYLIHKIERAPNVSRLIALVEEALGSGALSISRKGARWEVSEDGFAIYETDFATMRRRLASYVTDAHTYDDADEIASAPAPAMVPQVAQQQQACVAAPTPHPAGVPTNAWLDEEVAAFITGVIQELMPDEEAAAPRPAVDVREIAGLDAYVATRAWLDLVDRECASPHSVSYGQLFDARQAMQTAHARLDALTAKAAS